MSDFAREFAEAVLPEGVDETSKGQPSMTHPGHKIVKCADCGTVITQCRCNEPYKSVEYRPGPCRKCCEASYYNQARKTGPRRQPTMTEPDASGRQADENLLKAWSNKLYMAIHAVVSKYNREMDELDIAAPDSDLAELVKYTIFRHLRWHGEERDEALTARIAELEGAMRVARKQDATAMRAWINHRGFSAESTDDLYEQAMRVLEVALRRPLRQAALAGKEPE